MVVLFFISTTTPAFAFGGGRCFSRRETGLFSAKRLDTFSFREQGCQIIFETQSCYCFTEIGKMIFVLSQNFITESDTTGRPERRPLSTEEKAEARRVSRCACVTPAFPRPSLAWVPVLSTADKCFALMKQCPSRHYTALNRQYFLVLPPGLFSSSSQS